MNFLQDFTFICIHYSVYIKFSFDQNCNFYMLIWMERNIDMCLYIIAGCFSHINKSSIDHGIWPFLLLFELPLFVLMLV